MKKLLLPLLISFLLNTISFAQLNIGDKAINFSLKNIDDKIISLTDYSDEKGVILIFTCNHCPYSKLYEDRIVKLSSKYKKNGFPIIAINSNNPNEYEEDSFNNMILRAKEKSFDFPYLVDNIGIYKQYGATKTPHVYLLSNVNGQFSIAYIGAIDDNASDSDAVKRKYLEDAILSLKNGQEIKIKETKAIGCSIKPY